MAVLLDSGTVIAFLEPTDVFHTVADSAVKRAALQGSLVASVVTWAELLTGVELGKRDRQTVEGFFGQAFASIENVDQAIAKRAAQLRGTKKSLKMPDALILATADLFADEVITADAGWASLDPHCNVAITVLIDPASQPSLPGI